MCIILNNNKKLRWGIVAVVIVTTLLSAIGTVLVIFGKDAGFGNIKKYIQVRSILEKGYYQNVNESAMLEGSIGGMADSLKDPYTVYFTKEQMKSFMETSEGSYVGIGVSVIADENGLLTLAKVFDDSPAKNAGLLPGDKIIKVNDEDVTRIRDEDYIVNKIKGKEDTHVKMTLYRPSKSGPLEFDIVRKKIANINISSKEMPNNVGYIKLEMFDNEIASSFEKHLNKLLKSGIKSLVIDLRDNPGGDYGQVVKIADRLLPKGKIVYIEDKNGKQDTEYSDENELKMPIVLLVNGNSASASEVLSGAVKDYKKGKLIGSKTFGKGVVQTVIKLSDGSGLKVTIAKYFTPAGICIHGKGIQPDIEVKNNEKYNNIPVSDIPQAEDLQLNKALEVLTQH